MSIEATRLAIQRIALTLPGMRAAPERPQEQIHAWPVAFTFFSNGRENKSSATRRVKLYTYVTEIHVSRTDLGRDIANSEPYIESFPTALWADPTLGGAVATINEIRATYGPLGWGGMETFGVRFEIDCKHLTT